VNQLGSRDEAEDAVQTTFLNAHRALQRGVTPEAELPWLFKIAHNVCLTRRRSARRRVRVETPSDLGAVQDVLPAPTRDANDELLRLPTRSATCRPSQRRAILLREWQGLSYHEIADELKLSQSAVETLIFRARRTLASKLRTDGEGPSVVARIRKAFDAGALLTGLKALLEAARLRRSLRSQSWRWRDGRGHGAAPPRPEAEEPEGRRGDRDASTGEGVGGRGGRPHALASAGEADARSEGLEEAGCDPEPTPTAVAKAPDPEDAPQVVAASTPKVSAAAPETPPGQAKQAATEPERARGQDKAKPKDVAAEPPAPAEPPRAEPELPAAAQEHGPPEDPDNLDKGGGPKK
jgi:RNA polymerase sigma-70 factor (ECF subfamily)